VTGLHFRDFQKLAIERESDTLLNPKTSTIP